MRPPRRCAALLLGPLLGALLLGCRTADPEGAVDRFRFAFEGRDYEILGVDGSDRGYNALVRREGDRLVLSAADTDQDGRLDTLLAGALSLPAADRIYADGIRQALAAGLYRERPADPAAEAPPAVLVFTRTAGWRHASIPDGVRALRELGDAHGFRVDTTESPRAFTDAGLAPYAAVVFLNTTLDVLDAPSEAAFERFVRDGGGFVGVHAAADTEYDWPFYGRLVGAYFASHPAVQPGAVDVVDRAHPSTRDLPARWERTDEWYAYRAAPEGVRVLAVLDGATVEGSPSRPIAWCHERLGGRAWYTGMGHTAASYTEPAFRAHLAGGVRWAAGLAPGDCSADG
jgi:type 1 glutamine amidotransferase